MFVFMAFKFETCLLKPLLSSVKYVNSAYVALLRNKVIYNKDQFISIFEYFTNAKRLKHVFTLCFKGSLDIERWSGGQM